MTERARIAAESWCAAPCARRPRWNGSRPPPSGSAKPSPVDYRPFAFLLCIAVGVAMILWHRGRGGR